MQVRNFVIAAATGISTIIAAHAADMAVKAPRPAPPIAYTWTGCYVGANAGGACARSHGSMCINNNTGISRQAVQASEAITVVLTGCTGGCQLCSKYQTV